MVEQANDRKVGSPLYTLTAARIKEALRDPGSLFWTFGFPVLLAVVLGLAFREGSQEAQRVAIACASDAQTCSEIAQRIGKAPRVRVSTLQLEEALGELGRGKLELVLEVAAGSAGHAGQAGKASVVQHFDPARTEAQLARLAAHAALGEPSSQLALSEKPYARIGGRYIDYLMPGIVALSLMGSGVWGIGYSIVETRRRKLMRQLATTPIRRADFLFSYMLSRLLFLVPEVALLFAFGVLAFDTPMRGSLLAIAVLSALGGFAFTGLGLLIGARVASAEAVAGWANVVMGPMWLCSGVFFSYERFPEAAWPLIRALPLTALADGLRAVTNDGVSLAQLASELLVLGVWALSR
jgi:ABC-type multidrug transport system permease subunit